MGDRLDLTTKLEQKIALRARLDARVRQENAAEPAAAADLRRSRKWTKILIGCGIRSAR